MSMPPKMYTANAKGSNVEVFDALSGQRLYTISLGGNVRVTAGPYVNQDILSVYVIDSSGSHYLKVFSAKTGTIKYTQSA